MEFDPFQTAIGGPAVRSRADATRDQLIGRINDAGGLLEFETPNSRVRPGERSDHKRHNAPPWPVADVVITNGTMRHSRPVTDVVIMNGTMRPSRRRRPW